MNQSFVILEATSTSNNSMLTYQILSKIYKCQLGEYYIENIGCQICNSIQVKQNVTQCSLFDKQKYKNITSNQIELLPGFRRQYSDITELCFKNQSACLGGWNTGNGLCSKGHIGGLCEECDILNMRMMDIFLKIPKIKNVGIVRNRLVDQLDFHLFYYGLCFRTFLTLRSVKASNKLFSSLISMQKYGKILFKLNSDHKGFLIKMFINYLWIFSAIFTFSITFSFQANVVEQVSNPSVFMANSLDCLLKKFISINLVYFRTVVMFLLMIAQFFVINNFIVILCTQKEEDGKQFIFQFTNIFIPLKQWSNYQAIILVINLQIYFRCFLYIRKCFLIILYKKSSQLVKIFYTSFFNYNESLNTIIMLFLLLINQIQSELENILAIYLMNKEHKLNWELLKILIQSIIILFLIILETQILSKAIVLGGIFGLYQLFIAQQKPFIIKKFNELDLQS